MGAIEFDKVTKRFPDGTVAVDDLSLGVDDGEFMILVGPSGCGKTTALRMIAGLEEITDGEIRIGDRVVNALEPKERDVAMVFQSYALYPHMTVRDNIAFPLKMQRVENFGEYGIEIKTKVTCVPGGQWEVRKKLYPMIKQLFEENGIEFARPTVKVSGSGTDNETVAARTVAAKKARAAKAAD